MNTPTLAYRQETGPYMLNCAHRLFRWPGMRLREFTSRAMAFLSPFRSGCPVAGMTKSLRPGRNYPRTGSTSGKVSIARRPPTPMPPVQQSFSCRKRYRIPRPRYWWPGAPAWKTGRGLPAGRHRLRPETGISCWASTGERTAIRNPRCGIPFCQETLFPISRARLPGGSCPGGTSWTTEPWGFPWSAWMAPESSLTSP